MHPSYHKLASELFSQYGVPHACFSLLYFPGIAQYTVRYRASAQEERKEVTLTGIPKYLKFHLKCCQSIFPELALLIRQEKGRIQSTYFLNNPSLLWPLSQQTVQGFCPCKWC